MTYQKSQNRTKTDQKSQTFHQRSLKTYQRSQNRPKVSNDIPYDIPYDILEYVL
jgi:hypothetical protein